MDQGRGRESREAGLPACLTGLLNPQLAVDLPPPDCMKGVRLNNRELDKLVNNLGRNPATWRRSLLLHTWLQVCFFVLQVCWSCTQQTCVLCCQ